MPVATSMADQTAARIVLGVIAILIMLGSPLVAQAQSLGHIRDAGVIKLGYRTDARPFSFQDETGQAAGYAVGLCSKIAEQVKATLGLAKLNVEWVPVELDSRFKAIQQGDVDLLCEADSVTLGRREMVSFSIPIFSSGIGALLRVDAPVALREVLSQGQVAGRPIWRGSPARTVLEHKTFSAVAGTTSEAWLSKKISAFQIDASLVPVSTYGEGIQRVLDRTSDVFFGDLPILLDAAARNKSSGSLIVLDRHFTYEPLALAMGRGDEDLRLLVDRALSEFYRSDGFWNFFAEWFGRPDKDTLMFIRQTALTD